MWASATHPGAGARRSPSVVITCPPRSVAARSRGRTSTSDDRSAVDDDDVDAQLGQSRLKDPPDRSVDNWVLDGNLRTRTVERTVGRTNERTDERTAGWRADVGGMGPLRTSESSRDARARLCHLIVAAAASSTRTALKDSKDIG